ncbi:DUF2141 domain-containing protein [Cellulophaga tyrosinoxydans]|uniref:Uncharacterized conserved protein, DUF2141 family n=1 Tax=Cellulophaga tyrosinoxydans TaxID=504486 RepID=A0A1W2BQB7_9FLAO|nr:DUF2141 domain-containing protein [Cellulophaga tyrosinoxydans]SMC75147.1 Uncharacterized conserved protein, DUF2141 family [Cellulophaga tyrosinoxydans]
MKNLTLTIVLIFTSLFSFAQEASSNTITVIIDNISNDNGTVIVSLHSKDTFMKGAGIQDLQSKIENGKIKVIFKNVVPGEYAIMALHDENDNKRMDFELNGMPKESYGMSGNEMSFGPPNFVDAKFELSDKDLEFNIRF